MLEVGERGGIPPRRFLELPCPSGELYLPVVVLMHFKVILWIKAWGGGGAGMVRW